jgi:sugar phosphate isomerase/epimerase
MDKRIGAQLYTVRDLCKDAEAFDATMARLSEIGYKSVQISGVGPIAPEVLREICEKHSLAIACTHRGFPEYKDDIEGVIAYHKALGCDIAGLGGLFGEYRCTDVAKVDEGIEILNKATERLAEEGITFAYHNHAFEFARLDNGQRMFDRFVEKGKFSFILDTHWVAVAGISPAKLIEELGDRVAVLHYKDLKIKLDSNSSTYAEVGYGNLDFDSIVKVSDKARWAMVEQDVCDGDPVESLKMSYDYITSHYDFI